MADYSIFDIIGPVMIGPSSSHTAGAVQMAYVARAVFGRPIQKVTFYLHGSFAATLKGHGTDKALIAGICGLKPDSLDIVDSYGIAKNKKIDISFFVRHIRGAHPNTVCMRFEDGAGFSQEITGSSIGGGKIKIVAIDDTDVEISGDYTTLVTQHKDKPGFIADISRILVSYQINIAFMRLYRETRGDAAVMVLESDDTIGTQAIDRIAAIDTVNRLAYFEPF